MFDNHDDDEEGLEKFKHRARQQLFAIAAQLRNYADEVMNKYIALREATQVDSSPGTQIAKRIFDESEREGTHRRLLFKFHDAVYELGAALNSAQFTGEDEYNALMQCAHNAQQAYGELRQSAAYYYKLTQDSIAALQ